MNAVQTPLSEPREDAVESLKELLGGCLRIEACDFPDHERFLPATTPSNDGSDRRKSIDMVHLIDRLRCMQIERCAFDEELWSDLEPLDQASGDNTPVMDLASLVRQRSPMLGGWDLATCETPVTLGMLGGGCSGGLMRNFTPMNLGLGLPSVKGVAKCC
mmetsp:Transcript_62570/g.183485  ORF Transcript_62570/g.183485 Transcript_62570/m.183485 type:complete len:160 (-) Transcript_62570:260-739(-)